VLARVRARKGMLKKEGIFSFEKKGKGTFWQEERRSDRQQQNQE